MEEMGRSHGATATGFAMDAVEHACIVLGFESSPGFRGKLAEREEAVLVHWRHEKTGHSAALTQYQAETRARSQSCLSDWVRH